MFRRIVNAFRSAAPTTAGRKFVEQMEPRQLLAAAPIITNVIADHRGEVLITSSRFLRNVNKTSVKLFTAGADGVINTADDVRKTNISVSFNANNNRITIKANTESNAVYRVRLDSTLLTAGDGKRLDGEFTGGFPTGNGIQGGNFSFATRRDRGTRPVARWSTSFGVMNVNLFRDLTPQNITNFLDYVNSGRYDNMIFTRAEDNPNPFVIQGGGISINGSNVLQSTTDFAAVTGEPGVSNTRGRLSLALSSGPNSGTSEFFFNLADNSFLDGAGSGGPFTAFGEVSLSDATSLAVMDAIGGAQTVDFSQLNPPLSFPGTLTSTVPLSPTNNIGSGLSPSRDLVVVRHIGVRMKVRALT